MALVPALYRGTLRACERLHALAGGGSEPIRFRLPVTREAWKKGWHTLHPPGGPDCSPLGASDSMPALHRAILCTLTGLSLPADPEDDEDSRHTMRALFPALDAPSGDSMAYEELRELAREKFHRGSRFTTEPVGDTLAKRIPRILAARPECVERFAHMLQDRGFAALRTLSSQAELAACSSRCESEGVAVEAVPTYLGMPPARWGEEEEGQERWQWAYRCTVTNNRRESIQLLSRHWLILDQQGRVLAEVPRGSRGVIGQQPVIPPGASFEYASGTELPCAGGSMRGAFQCATLDRDGRPAGAVEARVAPFQLRSHKLRA